MTTKYLKVPLKINSVASFFAVIIFIVAVKISSSATSGNDDCEFQIVESMPDLMNFSRPIDFKPEITHEALIELINKTEHTLRIASFYWYLSSDSNLAYHPSTAPGRNIMNSVAAAVSRGVKLEVILDGSRKQMSNLEDVDKLKSLGTVKFLNMTKLLKSGVLHSKFLIADNKSLYLGSSNFDWRSYTQIKEMGIRFDNCKSVAQDLDKVFETLVYMSQLDEVPDKFPDSLKTNINIGNPMNITLDGFEAKMFLTSSPPAFNGPHEWTGRTDDIDGLLHIINKARKHIDISVMNYSPRTEFVWPKKFWPRIDNALRRAAVERRVRVRLLFSDWSQTKPEEVMWYHSLNALQSPSLSGGGIYVRMFKVPVYDDFQRKIPFSRVKHDKYMVTDNGLFIGTSNWAPDYFINTCGSSFVIEPANEESHITNGTIIANMQSLFERDFTSEFSTKL